jgi:hypothetical protein
MKGGGKRQGVKKVLAHVSPTKQKLLGGVEVAHNAMGVSHKKNNKAASICTAPIYQYRACMNNASKPMQCCNKRPPIECCKDYPGECKIYMECREFRPVTLNTILLYMTVLALALTGMAYAHKQWGTFNWLPEGLSDKLEQIGRIAAIGSYRLVPTKHRQEWERGQGHDSVGWEGEAIGVDPEC